MRGPMIVVLGTMLGTKLPLNVMLGTALVPNKKLGLEDCSPTAFGDRLGKLLVGERIGADVWVGNNVGIVLGRLSNTVGVVLGIAVGVFV